MSKRLRIGLLAGLLFTVALSIFTVTRSREPVYQGKKLSYWLHGFDSQMQSTEREDSDETHKAILSIGTNALPFLLEMLSSQQSPAKSKIQEWVNKQDVINIRFHDNDRDRSAAMFGFAVLGSIAKPAIPDLARMLNETNSFEVCVALSRIGPDAIPVLTNAFASTNQLLRQSAMWGFVEMRTNAESVLPLLIASLQDTNPKIRQIAVISIITVGTNQPAVVIPALINLLGDSDHQVSTRAIRTLGEFGETAHFSVPKLTQIINEGKDGVAASIALASIVGTNKAIGLISQAITNQSGKVQLELISVLGLFKTEALESIPTLLSLAQDENEHTRRAATYALIQIGAEADILIPILLEELVDMDSPIRSDVLHAIGKWRAEAKAAVPF